MNVDVEKLIDKLDKLYDELDDLQEKAEEDDSQYEDIIDRLSRLDLFPLCVAIGCLESVKENENESNND